MDYKAQVFSKNACFLRCQYGRNGLIVYCENIYKDYGGKKVDFFLLLESEEHTRRENKPKCASERAAANLVWKSAV